MADTKNLCAQIPLTLHDRVCTEKDQAGLTTAQYITNLLTEYYQMKENGGNMNMANNGSRTMAFQIPEELFQRIKEHLDRESLRLGRKYTQREFVLGLIEEALTARREHLPAPGGYRGHPAAPGGRRGRPAAPGGRRERLPVR